MMGLIGVCATVPKTPSARVFDTMICANLVLLRTRGSGVRISPGAPINQIVTRCSVQRMVICYQNATTRGDEYIGHSLAGFIDLVRQGVRIHVKRKSC
jgi:hypothetical protein